jgi:hypothetical protein
VCTHMHQQAIPWKMSEIAMGGANRMAFVLSTSEKAWPRKTKGDAHENPGSIRQTLSSAPSFAARAYHSASEYE